MNTISPKKILAFGALAFSLVFTGCLTDDKGSESDGPTISVSPDDEVVNAGQTATFSVTASGSGSLTYQWMKDGNDIAGATSSTYSFVAGSGDDGAEYKVKVTDENGSTLSNGAFLRIRVQSDVVTLGAQQSSTASSLDLDTFDSYNATQAQANSNIIDLVFATSTSGGSDSAAVYSPLVAKNGVSGTSGFDFMQNWATANNTDMRLVTVANWDNVLTASDIKSLYDQGTTPTPAGKIVVKVGTTFVAKSNSNLYVLMRVNSVTHSTSGTANFTGKAKW